MSGDIDIHQLDAERQVLFILKETDDVLSIQEIEDSLLNHQISPTTLSAPLNNLRKNRGNLLNDGLVHKDKAKYRIMQRGIEYLDSTVIVIDPSERASAQPLGKLLSSLSGDIKLCDPYFDCAAYELLKSNLSPEEITSINIIFSEIRAHSVTDYKIGNHSIKLKKKTGLHDRFILDDQHLYFFGTSLNRIGNKLSFIFNLSIYKDKFNSIFESYWNES